MRPNRSEPDHELQPVLLLTNGVTWYLRSSVVVSGERVRVDTPRTFLGFFPLGRDVLDSDLGLITGSKLGAHLYPARLAVGVALLVAAALLGWSSLTPAVLAAAVGMLLLSLIAVIRIERVGLEPFLVPVCLAHLGRASRVVDAINGDHEVEQSAEAPS